MSINPIILLGMIVSIIISVISFLVSNKHKIEWKSRYASWYPNRPIGGSGIKDYTYRKRIILNIISGLFFIICLVLLFLILH